MSGEGLVLPSLLLSLSLGETASASSVDFALHNHDTLPRREVVRVSVPLPEGTSENGLPGRLLCGKDELPLQERVITTMPDGSIRRIMLSFLAELEPAEMASYRYFFVANSDRFARKQRTAGGSLVRRESDAYCIRTDAWNLTMERGHVQLVAKTTGRPLAKLSPFGPALLPPGPPKTQVIESGPWFAWLRWRWDGKAYGREVDVRVDRLGRIRMTHRILRHLRENDWTPDFGFELSATKAAMIHALTEPVHFGRLPARDSFVEHPELIGYLKLSSGQKISVANPLALRQHRGTLDVRSKGEESLVLRFSRLEPVAKENDRLMLQEGMWRVSELIVQPGEPKALAATIDAPLLGHVDWQAFDAIYHTGPPLVVKHPVLRRLAERYVHDLMAMSLDGDDWGNLGWYNPVTDKASINSMVRYNHCRYVWEDWFRTGDPRLRRIALDWSENYCNFSVYWGPEKKYYGGSRRGRRYRDRPGEPHGPGTYMVRFNNAVGYCTKGYCGFWMAYEETGDPRFKEAAEAQARWSAEHVGYERREMRNVGMIADYAKLYEYTGDAFYLEQALRLWEGFKAKQEPDLLFTQHGKRATGNHLYIYDDAYGYKHPFYKPYMVQYATNALPYLLKLRPEDQRLHDTILASNDWMAKVQTPAGGWGYPAPSTGGEKFSLEYCHGLMLAQAIRADKAYLDAVQRCLRSIIQLYARDGAIPSGITAWEAVAGVKNDRTLYHLATDRNRNKDYTHGLVRFHSSPDYTVYFQVLLRDYLRFRPESSLFSKDEVLEKILKLPTSME